MNATAEIHRLSLEAIERHLRAAGAEYVVEEGEVRLASGHHVGLSIMFDEFVEQGNQVLAPVEWQVHVDASDDDKFAAGAIGVGVDEPTALASAVEEWYTLFATPVLAALGAEVPRKRAAASQAIAGWQMNAGQAGFRGTVPAALTGDGPLFRSILMALRDTASNWSQADHWQIRSMFVMASVEQGQPDIQAAVDGEIDSDLTDGLQKLDWPSGDGAYLYKQMFVFTHGQD
jgi:hypothetical protein